MTLQYFVYRQDKPNSHELRMKTRPAHMQYAEELGEKLLFAGPAMDDNDNMIASVWIVEAKDRSEAELITASDPYEQVELFESKIIHKFKSTAGKGSL